MYSVVWAAALAVGVPAEPPPEYRVQLDEANPLSAEFTLTLPPRPREELNIDPDTGSAISQAPECDGVPLERVGAETWAKPSGCREVRWSSQLFEHDVSGLDAARPDGAWSARNRIWLLTARLPWLQFQDQPATRIRAVAALADGRTLTQDWTATPGRGAPLYLVIGAGPVQRFAEDGIEIVVRGDVPQFAGAGALQQAVAGTWRNWRRDILPAHASTVDRLDLVWVQPRPGAEPGFYASTGSHAILMQYLPDPADPDSDAKLRAAIFLIGAHEGFHVLLGSIGKSKPAWVGESWASFFAWQAARRHLTGSSLVHAEELVATPVEQSILDAQRRWEPVDQAAALTFYSKGTRFWAAIEAVLDGPGSASGKLAALIQRTDGLRGVDWLDADAVAAELDRHSGNRAGPIVRCYLTDAACAG